jgi:hypothetical protein
VQGEARRQAGVRDGADHLEVGQRQAEGLRAVVAREEIRVAHGGTHGEQTHRLGRDLDDPRAAMLGRAEAPSAMIRPRYANGRHVREERIRVEREVMVSPMRTSSSMKRG